MKTDKRTGIGSLILMLILLIGVAAILLIVKASGKSWAVGPLVGYCGAGILGIAGWWTTRRALFGEPRDAVRFILGGILLRFILCGVFAGVVLGNGWLDPAGFVTGLLGGIGLFFGVEVVGLLRTHQRLMHQGVTGHD